MCLFYKVGSTVEWGRMCVAVLLPFIKLARRFDEAFSFIVKPFFPYEVAFRFSSQYFPFLWIFLISKFPHLLVEKRNLYLQVRIENLNFKFLNFSCLIQGIQFLDFSKFSSPGGFTNKIIIIIIIIIFFLLLLSFYSWRLGKLIHKMNFFFYYSF